MSSAFPPVVTPLETTVCGVVIMAVGVVRRILVSGNRYGCAVKCASDGRYGCVRNVKIKDSNLSTADNVLSVVVQLLAAGSPSKCKLLLLLVVVDINFSFLDFRPAILETLPVYL